MTNEIDYFGQIAIVGMDGRFPGAANTDVFWSNLRNGLESIQFFSDQDLTEGGVDELTLRDPNYVKAASFLEDIEFFDASFFSLTPREAELLDPQHRIFLECAWNSLENSGYDSEQYQGKIGIYAGADVNTYFLNNIVPNRRLMTTLNPYQIVTLTEKDYLSSRVAYNLNLRGPSVAVQTACSSALVAVHMACQSLINGECDMALAGAISIKVPQKSGYKCMEGGVLSPDGHCRAFDIRAKGTVFGSGVGIVVLKRLQDAITDGDTIHAVVKGSAINNDGSLRVGYSAPGVDGQLEVISEALAMSGVDPETISYVETHGTGTELGDPIEILALTQAYRSYTQKKRFCAIGSVKTNVGHLSTAAGVAGLIKTILALKNKEIPPSLHFTQPNPKINFAHSPFWVNTELRDWEATEHPRRAGVSSFGMGGSNAHIILEEAPELEASSSSRSYQLLVLSACTDSALEKMTDNLAEHLLQNPHLKLPDVAYTLQLGRHIFSKRRTVVCKTSENVGDVARVRLQKRDPLRLRTLTNSEKDKTVVFMFTGLGDQYINMAKELYNYERVFREQIDYCALILKQQSELDLLKELFSEDEGEVQNSVTHQTGIDLRSLVKGENQEINPAHQRLNQPQIVYPVLFTVEYALAQLLIEWGIKPQAMIGHSIGEYVAALLAGVFNLADALELVTQRGKLIQSVPVGSMLSVMLSEEKIQPYLCSGVSLAAINCPNNCVVAGRVVDITTLEKTLLNQGISCRRVQSTYAFHSEMMEPILEPFRELVEQVKLNPPTIPYISNLTGTWITNEEATDPAYWVKHLRQPVRFADGVLELLSSSNSVLLEVGPGHTLNTLALQHPAARGKESIIMSTLPGSYDVSNDLEFLLETLGRLWMAGVSVDWQSFYSDEYRQRVELPTYPFERKRFWLEAQEPGASSTVGSSPEIVFSLEEQSAIKEVQIDELRIEHSRPEISTLYVKPRNELEEKIARIWQQTLGIERIGVYDRFFELGGSSLMALQVLNGIRQTFEVEVSMGNFLQSPTVADLAIVVSAAEKLQFSLEDLPQVLLAPEDRYEPFPMTDVQQAYWIGRNQGLELGNIATHIYWEVESSDLDIQRFEKVWQCLIERHDMLRAIVRTDGQQQVLRDTIPYKIKITDFRGRASESVMTELAELRERMSHQVLPCDRWPLFEIRASRLEGKTRVHFSLDLLIGDAWSFMQILSSEVAKIYQDLDVELPPLELTFRDYVLAEQKLRETENYQRSLQYWRERLPTLPPAPDLPLAKKPSALKQPRFVRRTAKLEAKTWKRLRELGADEGLTPSGVLCAAFSEILTMWSSKPKFAINLTLFNRLPLHQQVNEIVGDFTSLTILEVDNSGEDSFKVRACRLQKQLWEDLDHRYVSGVQVMRELARLTGGQPRGIMPIVFTSILNQITSGQGTSFGDDFSALGITSSNDIFSVSQTPQVWLDHQVREIDGGILFNWDVVEELFPVKMINDMFAAYCSLLQRLTDEEVWDWPIQQLVTVPLGQIEERALVNASSVPITNAMLHTLFEESVEKYSEKVAVITPHNTLTYREVQRYSNQIGHWLKIRGATPNSLVAVVMEKGFEQVLAVLGILKSGAAYLPINPDLPQERIEYLLTNGDVRLVLTQSWLANVIHWPETIEHISIDQDAEWYDIPTNSLERVQQPTDLAYVIYTSGSTGFPKGVMIYHCGVVNTILDINQRFQIGPDDSMLALSSLSFDLSVYDIFGVLAAGGTVVIPDKSSERNPDKWLELINKYQITLWNTVPALMEMLVECIDDNQVNLAESLRLVLLSGDWIPLNLPERIRSVAEEVQVISLGGATEASIWSICYPVAEIDSEWKSIPYGKPLINQTFHVLDEALCPRPVWVPGQLYIGGIGLAKGYWRDNEKTDAAFIIHPHTRERLYRTGDLGRYLPDGNIEFLGREDFQVKIQGYRIELGEIETILNMCPLIKTSVVAVVSDSSTPKRLVGYFVPADDNILLIDGLSVQKTEQNLLEDIILDPLDRFRFKMNHQGIRRITEKDAQFELDKIDIDEEEFIKRRSYRHFESEIISREQFSSLLRVLRQVKLDGIPLPKYHYGSAGSLYPIQVYIYLKPGRVEGFSGGTYYYHPENHSLVQLCAEAEIDLGVYPPGNREIFEAAAFGIFLVAEMRAISPLYGHWSRDFCLLESGLMTQLLEMTAPQSQLGLCQIGAFDFQPIRHLFKLGESHQYLHTLLGGKIDSVQMSIEAIQEDSTEVIAMQSLLEEMHSKASFDHEFVGQLSSIPIPERSSQEQLQAITSEIRRFMREKLPDYMIPSAFIPLATIPLSLNGKVDRQALPRPDILWTERTEGFIPPQTKIEESVAEVWKEVLDLQQIGIYDNFFDLGGNSVQLVRVYNKLKDVVDKELLIVKLFEYPTVYSLSQYISQQEDDHSFIEEGEERGQMRRGTREQRRRKKSKGG